MSDVAITSPGTEQDGPLKVLLVDASDRGGIATYTAQLRQALREEGAEALLAAPAGVGDEGIVVLGRRWGPDIQRLGRLAVFRLRLAELGPAAWAFLRAVYRVRPNVVHVQTDVVSRVDHLLLRLVARRVPVVITAHDPVPQDGGVKVLAEQARRWRAADAVIIHGEEPRQLVESKSGGTPVFVVPVDLPLGGPRIPRAEARRKLGLADHPTALLLGQIRQYKGIDLLAGAWPKVAAALPDARLLLVGEPYDCPELEPLLRAPGVEAYLRFVPEEDIDAWAAAADVLVLPYHHGSHSGVLHRGLASGTPVLASPTLAEEVHRTGAGKVVALKAELWSDSLIEALGDRPLPQPPGPRSRQSVRGTRDVYRHVLSARQEAVERQIGARRRRRSPRFAADRSARITFYLEGDSFGGVERHVLHILDDLDRERFTPTVVGVMADETEQELTIRGVSVVRLDRVRSKLHVGGWLRVARTVQRTRPDVFHAMLSQSYAAQYALVAAIASRTTVVVVTVHLPTPGASRFQERLLHVLQRGVDVQVMSSEWTRSELIRLGQLHTSTEVIANGVDVPPSPNRQQARETLGIAAARTVIGGAMRLVPEKRADLVIEAARSLPGAVVVLLGAGPEEEHLRSLAQGVDLRLPGFRHDAVNLLAAFDVFVHPCPEDNQPLAILEAMGVGVPVVVADAGGSALMVDDGRTGLRAAATSEGMANAVAQLMADPALRSRLATAGREMVASGFTAQAMTRKLEAMYDRLLGRADTIPGMANET